MKTNLKETSKLTDIKGIGDVRAEWLQEIAINTIPTLLSVPAQEIESRLKANGNSISHKEIQDWQAQGRAMMPTNAVPEEIAKPKAVKKSSKGEKIASFVVEFQKISMDQGDLVQTLVHHMEGGNVGGGKSKQWQGLAKSELCEWMTAQIDEKYLAVNQEKTPPEPSPEPVVIKKQPIMKPTAVTIAQIQAYQPPDTPDAVGIGLSGKMFSSHLKSNQPFVLAVDLEFGPTSNGAVIPYQIHGYATNRHTGEVVQLTKTKDKIVNGSESKKTTRLPELSLKSGIYRLQTWVTVHTEREVLDFWEIPLLQVT